MTYAIGIDTGGTYTDGVIFDLKQQKTLVKTKNLTTYEDLSIGIRNCLKDLKVEDCKDIKLVALSTTLATNAIVEGRGSEVGLILIGEEPAGTIPVKNYAVIEGGHDIKGNPVAKLDLQKVQEVLIGFKGKVEAVAISGFASIRNPEHELQVKNLVQKTMDLPVVCGHELTTALGFHERTVTAVLNAKLIPVIAYLIASVKKVLVEKNIRAQLMVVKGDGTLMNEATALEKPIETILSGPAASIIGANILTSTPKALVLDMGGTTSDIAVIEKGIPRLNPEGAIVGGWRTRVQAADISTFGIGGDSYIRMGNDEKLLIGPQKVWPLAVIGHHSPYLYEELELQLQNQKNIKAANATDCYFLVKEPAIDSLTALDKEVIKILKAGAHSLNYIAHALGRNSFSLDLEHLINKGILAKAAVTPTDILHVTGEYIRWDAKTAKLGIKILANLSKVSVEEFARRTKANVVTGLCFSLLQSMVLVEGVPKEMAENLNLDYFMKKSFDPGEKDLFNNIINVKIPLIGIGAPAAAFLPEVAERLNTKLIIPPDWEVANAIGAASGKVMEKVKMLISESPDGYLLFSQWERKVFSDLEEAKEYALKEAKFRALASVERAGGISYQLMELCEDKFTNGRLGTYIETIVEVTAIGRPEW